MIAMALSCSPKLLIADEPTTALDVTIQAQILDELRTLRERAARPGSSSSPMISAVVADIADRVIVMYAGRVVEQGTLDELFYDPQHPYTWGLLGSITRVDRDRSTAAAGDPRAAAVAAARRRAAATSARAARTRSTAARRCRSWRRAMHGRAGPSRSLLAVAGAEARAAPGGRRDRPGEPGAGRLVSAHRARSDGGSRERKALMEVEHLRVLFPIKTGVVDRPHGRPRPRRRRRHVRAQRGRDARDRRRVGLRQDDADPRARAAARRRRSGSIRFRGQEITKAVAQASWRRSGGEMQMVFQDPQASLNPRKRVSQILATPLKLRGVPQGELEAESRELLELVGHASGAPRPLPARVLRRPAPADRDRAGARDRAAADPARRARVRARRLDPGTGDQPAARTSRRSSTCPTCSSPTTSASSATCRTGSSSCTSAS